MHYYYFSVFNITLILKANKLFIVLTDCLADGLGYNPAGVFGVTSNIALRVGQLLLCPLVNFTSAQHF